MQPVSTPTTPEDQPTTKWHTLKPRNVADTDFPPPDLILHKDDAGSKVFLALAKSLLSVDNRATTVRDLADLAVNHGLACQNTSAASQAITTYLRLHNDRCEVDHDQPLLLSHNMSGTDADDDLIPGLYSLQGGNPKRMSPNRRTNFRKKTTVWYLSRATGAPCPFARAGIRLCDYAGLAEDEPEKEHRRRREIPVIGQKRKRTLRSCVTKGSSDSEESEKDAPDDRRPQKKLTLRIKFNRTPTTTPSDSDESENMPVDAPESAVVQPKQEQEEEEEPFRLPPYPRRSISIPCYTPSYDGSYPRYPTWAEYQSSLSSRRSPSVAGSLGSPPPDSEDEADDFHVSMTRTDYLSSGDESEGQFESPGPRSPSAPLLPPALNMITVKEEPRDHDLLDPWHDDFEHHFGEPTVVRVHPQLKSEDAWDWDPEPTARIKEEDLSFDSLFSDPVFSPPPMSSPASSSRLTPDFHNMSDTHFDDNDPVYASPSRFNTIRARSKTMPVFSTLPTPVATASSSAPLPAMREQETPSDAPYPSDSNSALSPLIMLQEALNITSSASPSSLILNSVSSTSASAVGTVVQTCRPCNPPITAAHIGGTLMYQMVLDNFHFLRRADSDFVHLPPLMAYTQLPPPIFTDIPNTVNVQKGLPVVDGLWIPLAHARAYVKSRNGEFDVFLSDQLVERFPESLRAWVQSAVPTLTRHLGLYELEPKQTLKAVQQLRQPSAGPLTPAEASARHSLQFQRLQGLVSSAQATTSPFVLAGEKHDQGGEEELPLNETERAMFELCVGRDFDGESESGATDVPPPVNPEPRGSTTGGEDVQMVEEGGELSDTSSSLSSLDPSSPEGFWVPPPPQEEAHPMAMEEVSAAAGSKRKCSNSRSVPLRRSKRVASLSASTIVENTRSRRGRK